jgi:hypothetical protein
MFVMDTITNPVAAVANAPTTPPMSALLNPLPFRPPVKGLEMSYLILQPEGVRKGKSPQRGLANQRFGANS